MVTQPIPASDEQYVELFCLVTFTDDMQMFLVPTDEIDDPQMAEVCIPHQEPDKLYGITCYITNYPNWALVPSEMLLLQDYFDNRFAEVLHVFRSTGRGATD